MDGLKEQMDGLKKMKDEDGNENIGENSARGGVEGGT